MESSDTESSSWSAYSDCDCYRCQYNFSQSVEMESFPFYPSIQQPFVYFAQCRHGHVRKKDCKICRPNCFVRAFRWYTNEHGDKNKPCEGDRHRDRPCEPVPCKDPCNDECVPPRDPCSGAPNPSSFALWLDSKYHEFLTENADAYRALQHTETPGADCNMQSEYKDTCGKKRMTTVKNNWKYKMQKCQNGGQNEYVRNIQEGRNMSMEFIMTPKNLSHAASECCHPTPTCSGDDRHVVKSQSATATVCLNKSGYGNQECVKPPMEARADPYKTNKNISCQVMHTGHNAQTQYESSQPCNAICPTTPRCPPRAATYIQTTQPNQVSQNRKASTESHFQHQRDKSKCNVVQCKCPHDPNDNKIQKDVETKSVDFQQPDSKQQYSDFQQPGSGIQQPGSGFQQPGPGFQEPGPGLQQPGPGFQQPGPGFQQPGPVFQQPGPGFQPPQSYFQQPRAELQRSYPNSQQPCPDFQQPCPSSQQPASSLPYPCPSVNEPCPGFRPCPTLHSPCPPCDNTNLQINSNTQQREQITQFQSGPQVPYWEPNTNYQKPRPDIQNPYQDVQNPYQETQNLYSDMRNSSMHRTHKPCPDFQKPCPSLDPASNVFEPCPSLNDPCPGRKPCPTFREPCPPCPKSNICSTNIQQTTNLNINSQTQYQTNPMQREPYPNFQTNYQQQTNFDSQTRYQQQGPLQVPPQMESQTRYQQADPLQQSVQSRFDSQTRYQLQAPVQQSPQMIFEPRIPYQQPAGPIQQGSQMRYSEKNVEMQYYDFKPNQNACCMPNATRREQGPIFVESTQRVREMLPKREDAANVGFQEQYRAPGQIYREAGYSGAERVPGPCKTCSNLGQGTCDMNPNRRCGPCPECKCLECTTHGNTRCCKRMQALAPPPVKNVIIATAAAEGKCSSNCPFYASVSNKGETTQTVQFSQHSRDTTAQTSSTAIQLDRSTNPEYKLFMRVVCADKP